MDQHDLSAQRGGLVPPFFFASAMTQPRMLHTALIWALCAACSLEAQAQEAVWRCGQTLTNRLPDAEEERRLCQSVNLPASITVHTAPATAAAVRDRTKSVPLADAQIQPAEQKQRDVWARELLRAEMERVQSEWRQARAQGDAMRAARAGADLSSLQRELARWP